MQRVDTQLDKITTLRYKWIKPRSNVIKCDCIEWIHINLDTNCCGIFWTRCHPPVPMVFAPRRLLIKFLEDRRISAKSVAEQLGISRERVGSIIHEDLDMRKLSTKWVPKCLKEDQKRQRCQSSDKLLELFSARSKWFPVANGDHGRNLVLPSFYSLAASRFFPVSMTVFPQGNSTWEVS